MSKSFNPFPGLRPFEDTEQDVRVFFGRRDQVDELLARLHDYRFVGVVGESGCGKSSLVRAGLLPVLHAGFMVGAGSRWRIATMRPGRDPILSLARALEAPGALATTEEDLAQRVGMTNAVLQGGSLGLVEVVQQADLQPDESVLIVVDQFEELFTFRETVGQSYADDAAAFVKLILEAAKNPDVRVYVLVTMRSDFIGKCAQFRNLPETLNEGLFLVPRLTPQQLHEAIEGPVRIAGAEIAPRLVNRLLNSLNDKPDELPVLQHALMRTWTLWREKKTPKVAIDIADYEETGGIEEALSRHGNRILQSLTPEQQTIAERIFKALTTLGSDNLGVRRPTPFKDLCKIADAPPKDVRDVVNAFRAEGVSFLTPSGRTAIEENTWIDLTHEALMRNWDTLRGWVAQEAESAKEFRRLTDWHEMYAEGKGGILVDPQLSFAEQWRDRAHPTPAWAARYGGNLESILAYIARSRQEVAAEQRRKEQAHRAQLRVVTSVASIALIAAVIATWFGISALQARSALASQNDALRSAHEKMNDALYQARIETQIARNRTTAELAAERTANAERLSAESALAAANLARSQALAAEAHSSTLEGYMSLNEVLRGMEGSGYDARVTSLADITAYRLSPVYTSRALLLSAGVPQNALGRVALPPWNLGAIAASGRYIVVLAGERQNAYAQNVRGMLLSVDASSLGIVSHGPTVEASSMCGFGHESAVAVAQGDDIVRYAVGPSGQLDRDGAFSSGRVGALACLSDGRVLYVSDGDLRSGNLATHTTATLSSVTGNVNGLTVSANGSRAAVTNSAGQVTVYDTTSGATVMSATLLKDVRKDCLELGRIGAPSPNGADCGRTVAFAPNGDLDWYDGGDVHAQTFASTPQDDEYACPQAACAHASLAFPLGAELPTVIGYGGVYRPTEVPPRPVPIPAYANGPAPSPAPERTYVLTPIPKGTVVTPPPSPVPTPAHEYKLIAVSPKASAPPFVDYEAAYDDLAGAQRDPLFDAEFAMYVTPYDPQTAHQPNPLGSGLASQSLVNLEEPLIGTVPNSQWAWDQDYGLAGTEVLIPQATPAPHAPRSHWTTFLRFDLDQFRRSFGSSTVSVSYGSQMRDCADGAHAITYDWQTGKVTIYDIRRAPARPILSFNAQRIGLIPHTNTYAREAQIAYDPASRVATLIWYKLTPPQQLLTMTRYLVEPSGARVVGNMTGAQILAAARVSPSNVTVNAVRLSSRGTYLIVRTKHGDVMLRTDGKRIGDAYAITVVSPNETLAMGERQASDGVETIYRLPSWKPVSLTGVPWTSDQPIPNSAAVRADDVAMTVDGRTLAYVQLHGQGSSTTSQLMLYDVPSWARYSRPLPNPPDLGSYVGLTFSADGRYLLAAYNDTDGYHKLAVYAVDPEAWIRSACLMAGRSLTQQELRDLVGSHVPYRDPCAQYANQMYRW